MKSNRGFYEIGIIGNKTPDNLGTLWRSACIMGAAGIFTIGRRYPRRQSCDTMNTPKHVPLREYDDFESFLEARPRDTQLIGIELIDDAVDITEFKHPERAIYLLGAEDTGIPRRYWDTCQKIIKIPFYGNSLNVAVTGSIVMYDRYVKSA